MPIAVDEHWCAQAYMYVVNELGVSSSELSNNNQVLEDMIAHMGYCPYDYL